MVTTVVARPEFTLRLRRRFNASREKVFAAWTRPEALKRWWCPAGWLPLEIEIDLKEGGHYVLSMQRESGAQVIAARGTFITVKRPVQLVYTWKWDGVFDGMPVTCVAVDFRSVDGATEIEFCQRDLSLSVCGQHLTAWMDAFGRLANTLPSEEEGELVNKAAFSLRKQASDSGIQHRV